MARLYYKKSPISGLGLFTRSKIAAGEVLFPVVGREVSTDELSEEFIRSGLMQGVSPGRAIISEDGTRSLFSYMNHASDCNCAVDLPGRRVVSIREIEPEEELTVDYDKEPYDGRVRRIVNEALGRPAAPIQ